MAKKHKNFFAFLQKKDLKKNCKSLYYSVQYIMRFNGIITRARVKRNFMYKNISNLFAQKGATALKDKKGKRDV